MVDSEDEVREMASEIKEGEDVLCITGEEPEALIRDRAQKFNIKPGNFICRNGIVDKFGINGAGGIAARVRRALMGDIVGDQPDDREKWCQTRYEKVKLIEKLSNEIAPREALSYYRCSVMSLFKEYCRGPLCGLLRATPDECEIMGIDVVRAYTCCRPFLIVMST